MLPNGQLVSGGGSGRLQFWDTRSGTLLQEFTEHKADVLTIAVSPDGESVFAAGIDERIAMFRRVTSADGDQSAGRLSHHASLPINLAVTAVHLLVETSQSFSPDLLGISEPASSSLLSMLRIARGKWRCLC